jgi:hypothetical protein
MAAIYSKCVEQVTIPILISFQMWMNVLEDWTTAAIILNVITLLGVFHADVTMVIPEMA